MAAEKCCRRAEHITLHGLATTTRTNYTRFAVRARWRPGQGSGTENCTELRSRAGLWGEQGEAWAQRTARSLGDRCRARLEGVKEGLRDAGREEAPSQLNKWSNEYNVAWRV